MVIAEGQSTWQVTAVHAADDTEPADDTDATGHRGGAGGREHSLDGNHCCRSRAAATQRARRLQGRAGTAPGCDAVPAPAA